MSEGIRVNTRHNICNHSTEPPQIQRRMFTETPVVINRVGPTPVQHYKELSEKESCNCLKKRAVVCRTRQRLNVALLTIYIYHIYIPYIYIIYNI